MMHFCKYCVGTGKTPYKNSVKICFCCMGTGLVSTKKWLGQSLTLGGAGKHTPGYGPTPPEEVHHRLKHLNKIGRLYLGFQNIRLAGLHLSDPGIRLKLKKERQCSIKSRKI